MSGWPLGPAAPRHEPHALDLWHIDLDVEACEHAQDRAALIPQELARADRFLRERDRLRFARARRALRDVLARYLRAQGALPQGGGARQVALLTEHRGKPCLAPHQRCLEFNLSHSDALAVLLVGPRGALGVDVERVDPTRDVEGIARYAFAPGERQALLALGDEAARRAAFFRVWTRKEAYLKALGLGLSVPLDSFEVTLDADDARLLDARHEQAQPGRWTLRAYSPGPGYEAALAHDLGADAAPRYWRWTPR